MNGRGKSDRSIRTAETAEQRQVRTLTAEAVEGRGLAKGNLLRQNKYWTQCQGRVVYEGCPELVKCDGADTTGGRSDAIGIPI